ncbi:tyrosine-type recombinase/integrase [Pseudoalteromonas nigrifaciens]|uniref:tyrosine-type recombinase/integrase n=1 Tax=Pseudoalteromonas nigrifaciens TaxID=28109 RepID=UPI003D0751D3
MINVKRVWDYEYGARKLNFYCLVGKNNVPLFEPSLFLFKEAIKGASENTTRGYANDLKSFFSMLHQSLGGIDNYKVVTDTQMNGYLNGFLYQKKCLKPATITRHIAAINRFYTFCYDNGFMSRKSCFSFSYVDNISTETMLNGMTTKLHRTYLSKNTFEEVILGSIKTKSPFLKERDELALKLGYYGGFRSGELVSYGNLNGNKLRELLPKQDKRTIQSIEIGVRGKGKKLRTIRLGPQITEAIYNFIWGRAKHITNSIFCAENGRLLMNKSYGSQLFRECKNNYLSSCTLLESEYRRWEERSYHLLRACYATNMVSFCVEVGIDPRVFVTQWMGHSNPKTTEIYIFYDAVLNNRLKIIEELSLNNTFFGQTFRQKFNIGR